MPELANLPDAIDNEDAVRYHGFADVPGTTLTVHLADDADAFDMSRVVAMVDDYGYDLDDSTEVEWLNGSHVVLTFTHERPPESDDADDGDDDVTYGDDAWVPSDAEIAEAFGVDDVDDITDEMLDDVDVPDTPDRVDVSGYKTAAGAAKATAKALREWADFYGYNPDDVLLYDPETTKAKRGDVADGVWCVAWEGGFFEWAVALTGGESMTSNEGYGRGGDPEVAGLLDGAGFDVECYYSFDLLFYNR